MTVLQRALALTIGGVILLLTITAGAHASPGCAATCAATDSRRLDSFVVDQMERADIPGVAYAVVGPDGVEHQGTYGEDGDGRPVTAQTPFLWGSVAKPVTASLVVKMAGAGDLDLDERVRTYLPNFTMADAAAQRITVRHLLSQTGGIPERLDLTDRFDPDRRPGDVVERLADVGLAAGVGEKHLYSSINYVILGAIVEEVTDRTFADVLRERLLVPAEMSGAITNADEAAERLPPGHRYVLGNPRASRTRVDPAGLSSGYLGGSLDDAIAFARANLSGSKVLTDAQRATLVHPEVSTGTEQSYALGWRTWPVFDSDKPMIWHSGAAPGYQASIVLLPQQDRAVVVLQNVYGSFQETQLLDTSWGLASLLSGGEPEIHGVEPLYVVLLAVIGATFLGLLAALGRSLWRVRRPVPSRTRRRTLIVLTGWLVCLAMLEAGLLALPRYFGVTLGQMTLWAPDIAVLLDACLVLVALLAVCRVAVTARARRHAGTL